MGGLVAISAHFYIQSQKNTSREKKINFVLVIKIFVIFAHHSIVNDQLLKIKTMNANEKAFEISRSFDETLHDVTYEAASKMAKWLLQEIYDRIDVKRKAINTDEGWDAFVKMSDIDIILNELNGTPLINADAFDKALKDIANETFLKL